MESYVSMWKKYAEFSGRTSRRDYWIAIIINAVIISVLQALSQGTDLFIFILIEFIYSIAIILPFISISVRRMHDINKNGCWILINLIPIIGGIWFVVLSLKSGTEGENEYGDYSIN